MADISVTQEQMALRRRARRRLVGAIAIALTAFLVLPMLFDPEPKPLGPDVEIRIPSRDTPFDEGAQRSGAPELAPEATLPPEPPPVAAEPTQPQPAASVVPEDGGAETRSVGSAKVPPRETPRPEPPVKVAETPKPREPSRPPDPPRPVAAPLAPEATRPATAPSRIESNLTARGYFLQLGAFSSGDNARALRDKAIAAGFNAVLVETNGQYRVRVGPVAEHARAQEIQASLKAKGFSSVLIGS